MNVIIVSLFTTFLTTYILFRRSSGHKKLPPGPSFITSNFLLLTNPLLQFEPILKNLKAKYGPFFTLSTFSGPAIIVANHSLAHQVLIQLGTVFSDRPKTLPFCNISSASYGPTWRLFRRNIASEIMHPAGIKSYSSDRKWALRVLFDRINQEHEVSGIKVVEHFRYALFCVLVLMCFGEKFEESQMNKIAKIQRDMLVKVSSGRFLVLTMFPRLGKILFRNRLKEFEKLCNEKDEVLLPIIKSRIESPNTEHETVAYVDTLTNLHVPRKNGEKLSDRDMVSMCSEFLGAGTETTTTALQWIMANLVKYPHIQRKMYEEIVGVVGPPPPGPSSQMELESVIEEEDLKKMPYVKAVVLEGLRRHSPLHFLLPHRVMEEVEVEGYTIPKGATINVMVGEISLDPEVWDEPMEFKPERFLANGGVLSSFDINGSKGINMMPFGAGRRICSGSDLALLHLEYFVANLVWYYDWNVADGYVVDLSEEVELSVVMKYPLRAKVSYRARKPTA